MTDWCVALLEPVASAAVHCGFVLLPEPVYGPFVDLVWPSEFQLEWSPEYL